MLTSHLIRRIIYFKCFAYKCFTRESERLKTNHDNFCGRKNKVSPLFSFLPAAVCTLDRTGRCLPQHFAVQAQKLHNGRCSVKMCKNSLFALWQVLQMIVDDRPHFHLSFLLYLLQLHKSCLPPYSIFAIREKLIEIYVGMSRWSWYHLEAVTQNGTRAF